MNCPRHPEKRTVIACKDCGAEFCMDCVRETDQTTLCPECYRRKLSGITKEYTFAESENGGKGTAPGLAQKAEPQVTKSEKLRAGRAARKQELAARRERLSEGRAPEILPEVPPQTIPPAVESPPAHAKAEPAKDDFLARGPDEDFSFLEPEKKEKKPRVRWVAKTREKEEAAESAEMEQVASAAAPTSSDDLISDVVSTLLMPGAEEDLIEEMLPLEIPAGETPQEIPEERPRQKPREKPQRQRREKPERLRVPKRSAEEIRAAREERMQRWSFLAQPRTQEFTAIGSNRWRAAGFVILMLLLGAVLWALPNAYLIPKDQEYGIHSLLIGITIGLLFWWKAGKKHGNKLAIQAALVTFFSLFLGEFLHWFLIIAKNQAFRTIFFDLISFKFLWENGGQIIKNIIEAMFPMGFPLDTAVAQCGRLPGRFRHAAHPRGFFSRSAGPSKVQPPKKKRPGMAWKIEALQDEGKGIVEIAGVVDSTNVEDFFTFLTSVYKSGIIRIILDLKNTSYLSSAGLSVIMDTFNKAQRDGGKLVIARASHMVKDLFRLVQFVKIMEFYDNLNDAINAI